MEMMFHDAKSCIEDTSAFDTSSPKQMGVPILHMKQGFTVFYLESLPVPPCWNSKKLRYSMPHSTLTNV
eukprot:scaffold280680_cov60-Attheya_sp.AAC.1